MNEARGRNKISVGSRHEPARRFSRRAAVGAAGAGLAGLAGMTGTIAFPARTAGRSSAAPLSGWLQATPSGVPDLEAMAPQLQAVLDARVDASETVGSMAAVWTPTGQEWIGSSGIGNLMTDAPLDPAAHFRIASITKTFVATAVLMLVDQEALSLDDVLETFVPGIANGERTTIHQLLHMTSGTYDYLDDQAFADAFLADPLMPFSMDDALAIIRDHEPNFAPGESFRYSNSNYLLLGIILEAVTGEPVEQLIDRMVLGPLGLERTSFPTTPDLPDPYIRGYLVDESTGSLRDVTYSNPAIPWTAGAMISTFSDMRVWAEEVATGSLLLPETQAMRLDTMQIRAGSPIRYGLGLFETRGFIGHNGGIFGYSSIMVHRPADGVTIVTMENQADNVGGGADAVFAAIGSLLFPDDFVS